MGRGLATRAMNRRYKLAIVGCGAVAEIGHLPALKEAACFDTVALVDRQLARAESLARDFGVPRAVADYEEAIGDIEAAIVALPHNLHAPVCSALLRAGKHVLVEKPMAITSAECDAMLEAARQTGAKLAVGHVRRFFPALQHAKHLIDSGALGTIRRFDLRDGYTYSWPVASDFFFRKETAGGGVLLDTGAHTLDTLLWYLGDVAEFSYRDDAYGGVEADALIDMRMRCGASGTVELSRTRILRNSVIVEGDEGSLEAFFHEPRLTVHRKGRRGLSINFSNADDPAAEVGLAESLRDQLVDWHASIAEAREPYVSGVDGARVVSLMEAMYARRERWVFPWEDGAARAMEATS